MEYIKQLLNDLVDFDDVFDDVYDFISHLEKLYDWSLEEHIIFNEDLNLKDRHCYKIILHILYNLLYIKLKKILKRRLKK